MGIGAKWNGNAKICMNERIQMKINDYRLEVKRYAKPSFTVKTGQSRIPKFWRTYYWGSVSYTHLCIFAMPDEVLFDYFFATLS